MVPGFGKQTITIGSDPHCDMVLVGEGVAPEHARLIHQGGGRLMFTNLEQGVSMAAGRQMGPGEHVPFDFRTQFYVGSVEVPFDHPSIALCLMAYGQTPPQPGELVIGRDPSRATLVLQHPSVSSLHATVRLDQLMVTDHQSTSGTYVGGARIGPNAPTPLSPDGVVHFGPVPVQVALLTRLGQALASGGAAGAPQPVAPGSPGAHPGVVAAQAAAAQGRGGQPGTEALNFGSMASAVQGQGQGQPPASPAPMRKHKTVFGQLDFSGMEGGVKSIGRTPNNDIQVPHPQVSARHAQVEQAGGALYVTDLGSANGTYVRGQRVQPQQKVQIQSGEKIYVGPMPLQLHISASGAVEVFHEAYAQERWAGRPLYEIEAWSLYLEVPDRDDKSKMKVLLDNVSFKALPGDMIALMGPSGAGKTTLLLALNGYKPPTAGLVRINGEDLYNIYDTLRGSIGYVPQDDLVHSELTVFEAVRYSARARLPPDFSDDEIDERVMQTLRDLGLETQAHLQIGAPEKKILSGGQRKRVNIALELVTDPVILYLDEPTSGLAADDATALVNLLHDLTKATGKTIIMTIHQPAKDEFEKFNNALILGYGGVPMFFGPTQPDAYRFFGGWLKRAVEGGYLQGPFEEIDNPRDMFAAITAREQPIYQQLLQQDPNASRSTARHQAAMQWRDEFFSDQNPTYTKMYSGRRAVGTGDGQRGIPEGRPKTRGQFRLLMSRYLKVKVRDTTGTLIMFAQAPIIAVLLGLVFGSQSDTVPAWCLAAIRELGDRVGKGEAQQSDQSVLDAMSATQDHSGAIFFMVIAAIWFGTSNAAREIVRERAIYLRERMVNLGLVNYVMSKFVLLTVFSVVQCAMLIGIVFPWLGFHGGVEAFFQELAALCTVSATAVAIGLVISTWVSTSEAAMALTPIALIPQVVLGGLMVPMTTIKQISFLMYAIPARWGFEAAVVPEMVAVQDDSAWLIDLGTDKTSAADFVVDGHFQCAVAQLSADNFNGSWGFENYEATYLPYAVLLGATLGFVLLLCILLKRRDPV